MTLIEFLTVAQFAVSALTTPIVSALMVGIALRTVYYIISVL